MRRTRAEQREHNRRALLASTRHLLTTRGTSVPVDTIAEAADLTTGAVYSIFGSKRDLFLAVVEESVAEYAEGVARLGTAGATLPGLVEAYARWVAAGVTDDFPEEARLEVLMVLLCLEDPFFRDECLRLQRAQRDALAELLTGRPVTDGPAARPVGRAEATLIASSLLAVTAGFLLRGIPDGHRDLDAMVRACSALTALATP
ncbi:TetR/AcrR family transcriptional regulator [Streptomyces sp. NPDC020875]|uniref:TetR/AcrR family transcriptional regulator n=1 Tax=Streptomyces sp. NPDC020875 TaxID=3154898 RepID=UPI00340FD409